MSLLRHKTESRKVTHRRRVITYKTITKTIVTVEKPYVVFGRIIADLRQSKRITQQEVADRIGLSRASLANIETGRQRIYLSDVFIYAKIFDVEPEFLFGLLVRKLK